ncbi:MAG: hypothetical protein K2H44_01425 [Muribaculaceae bacterium]|nr:hypothetical protein [Muribaculaceae bacterium]
MLNPTIEPIARWWGIQRTPTLHHRRSMNNNIDRGTVERGVNGVDDVFIKLSGLLL